MMKQHIKQIVSVTCCLTLAFGAFATDWYVDQTNGNNDRDGKSPATAKKALSTVWKTFAEPGDTVWIMGEMKISSAIDINENPGIVIAGYGDNATISLKEGYALTLLKISVDSVVSNLTLKGGICDKSAGSDEGSYPAAGAEVSNGKLTHCRITGCRPKDANNHCSAVRITGTGVVESCDIYDNDAGTLKYSYAAGVDLKETTAKLLNSRIYNCRGRACAVFVEKGLVEGCEIFNNTNYPASQLTYTSPAAGSGAGLRVDGSGSRVSRCRIYGNYGYGNGGGFWLRDGAIVENCLICENHAATSGGAIYSNSGNSTIRFCNIGGNVADSGDGAAIYVNGGSPVFKNNIIYGNGADPDRQIKLESASASASFTYSLLPVEKAGVGNVVATKSPYVDAAQGNYLTADDSEGIDRAQEVTGVSKDLLGTLRPLDGGTGIGAVSDIGCVEYVNSAVLTSPIVYMNPDGSNEAPYDTAEKGAHSLVSALLAVDFFERGYGEVRVCAGGYESLSVDAEVLQPILICGWDLEKDAASETNVMLPGTSLHLNHAAAVVSGIDFSGRCADRDYCVKVTQGMVTNCVIRDFRYEIAKTSVTAEGRPNFTGGALVLSGSDVAPKVCRAVDSVISNCVVKLASDFTLKSYMFGLIGGGVAFRSATEATLERCLVCDCSAAGNGGGITVESNSARILDCEVARCKASIKDNSDTDLYVVYGGGIFIKGTSGSLSYVSGCSVHDNFSNGSGGGVYVGNYGGPVRIWNCRIEDNEVYAFSGTGLRVERESSDVAVVNSLITGNNKGKKTGAASGVYLKGGKLINCTVSGNRGGESAAGVTVFARTASDVDERGKDVYVSYVRNSIVWGNMPTYWDGVAAKDMSFGGVGNDCSNVVVPEADKIAGTSIITADPRLSKTYELRGSSSAINAGNNSFYNVDNFGDKDLAGNDRFYKGRTIDCGCFERGSVPGLMLLVR